MYFILFLFSANYVFALDQVIVGVGMADIIENRVAEARNLALQDALRNVVEKGLGVFIKSETEVKDAALVKDQILSKAEGYISEYDVVKEQRNGQTYTVTVTATISLDKLGDDIKKFVKKIKAKMSNPAIAFVLTTWERIGETGQKDIYKKINLDASVAEKLEDQEQHDSYNYAKDSNSSYGSTKYDGSVKARSNSERSAKAKANVRGKLSFNEAEIEGEGNLSTKSKENSDLAIKEDYKTKAGYETESLTKSATGTKSEIKGELNLKTESRDKMAYKKIDEKLWKKYSDTTIIDSFQQEFKNKGFDLRATDKARAIALAESLERTSIDINDRNTVKKFAEKEGANFVARGEVKILEINKSSQTGNYNATSQIGVEIIDVNSGDIVASYTNTATGTNQVVDNAKFQSIKKLAILAAKTLAEQTLITWDERANKGRQYVLEFQNIKSIRKQKKQILDLLNSFAEIIHQTNTEPNNLVLTILFKGSKTDLESTIFSKIENLPGFSEKEFDGPYDVDGKLVFKFIN